MSGRGSVLKNAGTLCGPSGELVDRVCSELKQHSALAGGFGSHLGFPSGSFTWPRSVLCR